MPTRRTKGDGGLTQRHDHASCPPAVDGARPEHSCRGRWQGTIDVLVDGRRRRKYVYGSSKKQAGTRLKDAVRERDQGTLVMATVTVESWMTDWLARRERSLKPQTMRSYREKVRNYIVPHLGHRRLTSLRAEHIEAMYDAMRDAGRAEATARQVHAILKKALADAIKRDKLAISPMAKVEPPGTQKNRREAYDVEQARQVLAAAGDDSRWWLALFYGMRQGEVLGLDWAYVDFAKHRLKVDKTLQTNEAGQLFLGEPKTKRSKRTLPLVPVIEARLRLLWELEGRPTEGLVFHNGSGGPIQPKRDWLAWRELIDRATVPPYAPLPYIALHAARNSAASVMEAARVPDRLIMQILGQSQVQTTHGYQHADEERIAQALMATGSLLELE